MKTEYTFYEDPGHGWLAVKRGELERLNILSKISSFSYQNGGTVYLEEDCDARVFVNAKEERKETVTIKQKYQENTPIRHYNSFNT